MATCETCGAEVDTAFCPYCGAAIDPTSEQEQEQEQAQTSGHEVVFIKPRYNALTLTIAGIGMIVLVVFLMALVFEIVGAVRSGSMTAKGALESAEILLFTTVFSGLCFLPGILLILKRTPSGYVGRTIASFLVRAFFFIFAWSIALMFCATIVGAFLGAWRIGTAVSRPGKKGYTAYADGEKIPVTRVVHHKETDWEESYFDDDYVEVNTTYYMYVDESGNVYY